MIHYVLIYIVALICSIFSVKYLENSRILEDLNSDINSHTKLRGSFYLGVNQDWFGVGLLGINSMAIPESCIPVEGISNGILFNNILTAIEISDVFKNVQVSNNNTLISFTLQDNEGKDLDLLAKREIFKFFQSFYIQSLQRHLVALDFEKNLLAESSILWWSSGEKRYRVGSENLGAFIDICESGRDRFREMVETITLAKVGQADFSNIRFRIEQDRPSPVKVLMHNVKGYLVTFFVSVIIFLILQGIYILARRVIVEKLN